VPKAIALSSMTRPQPWPRRLWPRQRLAASRAGIARAHGCV